MSISYTYTQLVAAIKTYAEDIDAEFVAEIPDFIAKGESRVISDLNLEEFEQWLEVSISGSDRSVAKPTDVVEISSLFIRNPSTLKWFELPRRTFEYCQMYAPTEATLAVPAYYSVNAEETIYVVPTPDQSYTGGNAKARCIIRPTGLSAANENSHLGDHFAGLLFQAVMIEAYEFLKHQKAMESAAKKYQSLVPAIQKEIEDVIRPSYKGLNKTIQGADD